MVQGIESGSRSLYIEQPAEYWVQDKSMCIVYPDLPVPRKSLREVVTSVEGKGAEESVILLVLEHVGTWLKKQCAPSLATEEDWNIPCNKWHPKNKTRAFTGRTTSCNCCTLPSILHKYKQVISLMCCVLLADIQCISHFTLQRSSPSKCNTSNNHTEWVCVREHLHFGGLWKGAEDWRKAAAIWKVVSITWAAFRHED